MPALTFRRCWKVRHSGWLPLTKENAFVDFWGRLRKEKERHTDTSNKRVGIGEKDEPEEEETVSVLDMASRVDLGEIESVLKVRRWRRKY